MATRPAMSGRHLLQLAGHLQRDEVGATLSVFPHLRIKHEWFRLVDLYSGKIFVEWVKQIVIFNGDNG